MEVAPSLFMAKVMHKRLFPKVNQFTYNVYYLALPISKLLSPITTDHLAVNRFGFLRQRIKSTFVQFFLMTKVPGFILL